MLELEHGFRVVDVHARLPPDEQIGERGRAISPDRLEREMHQAGIVRAIVSPEAKPGTETSYVAQNNNVARLSVDRPFVAFARINGSGRPSADRVGRLRNLVERSKEWHTTPADVEQYAYDDRFDGFTLDPGCDGIPDEAVLESLEDVGLPVLVRLSEPASPDVLAATLLGRSFPVVVAHFGGSLHERDRMDETIDLLEQYDDCYVDTSFVRYRDQLERALLEHPDRVLFGSGAPACHPNVAVMEILTLDVSEDKLWRAFSKNASRIIEPLSPETD